jgi:hypothetical protein
VNKDGKNGKKEKIALAMATPFRDNFKSFLIISSLLAVS